MHQVGIDGCPHGQSGAEVVQSPQTSNLRIAALSILLPATMEAALSSCSIGALPDPLLSAIFALAGRSEG